MIRPTVVKQDVAAEALEFILQAADHPYADWHAENIDKALIIPFTSNEDLVGALWFYALEEDTTSLVMHAAIFDEYKGRFFTPKLVDHVSSVLWSLGFNSVVVEDDYVDLALRMGAEQNPNGSAVFNLPHRWRKKWPSQQKK